MQTHTDDADAGLRKCKLELDEGKFVFMEATKAAPVIGNVCINCKTLFEKGFDPISQFSISLIPATPDDGLEDEHKPIIPTCSSSDDELTNVTIFDALLSIFTSSNLIHLKKSRWTDELRMCFKCAQVLCNLYQSYIELLRFSHPAAHICQLINQIELWHKHARRKDCQLGEDEILDREDPDSFTRFVDAIVLFDARKCEKELNSDTEVKVKVEYETEPRLERHGQNKLFKNGSYFDAYQTKDSNSMLSEIESPPQVFVSRRSDRIAVQKQMMPTAVDKMKSRRIMQLKRKRLATYLEPTDKCHDKTKKSALQERKGESDSDVWRNDKEEIAEDSDFFGSEAQLPKIRRKRSPVQKVQCPVDGCEKKVMFHWLLRNHIQLDHEKKVPKKCSSCGFSSVDLHHFDSHICNNRAHLPDVRWRCDFCGRGFSRRNSMFLHARIHDRSILKCSFPDCKESFLLSEHLETHEEQRHQSSSSVQEPTKAGQQWQCSECGKVFQAKQTFKIHMEIHSSIRKYLCNTCGMSFKQRRSLTRHDLIHKELDAIVLHQCPLCGRSFKRKYNLTQHYQSKVHPQDLIRKILNGEELGEDELKNSTLKRTRQKPAKKVGKEDNHQGETTTFSTSSEDELEEEPVFRDSRTTEGEDPPPNEQMHRFTDSLNSTQYLRIYTHGVAAQGKSNYPAASFASLTHSDHDGRIPELTHTQETLESQSMNQSQSQRGSQESEERKYASSHFLPMPI